MSRRSWTLLVLLTIGSLNIMDRSIVNVLAEDIKADLGISDAQLGLLTGTSFGILYAVMGLPLGRLADRVNRFHLIAGAMAFWSAFTVLCGLVTNYAQLLAARTGVAIGEAGSTPASIAIVSEMYPDKRRSFAMAVLLLGGSLGVFLGLLLGGVVGGHWGWRVAFLAAGVPGLLMAVFVLAAMRDTAPAGARVASGDRLPVGPTLRVLFGQPRFLWLAVAHTCATFLVYAASAWLPSIFIRTHGMTTTQIGIFGAVAFGIGGAIGTLGGGGVADVLRPRIRRAELSVVIAALALSLLSLSATIFLTDRTLALTFLFVFNCFGFAFLAPSTTLIQSEVKSEMRGFAQSICLSMSVILNLGVGVPLVGLLSDHLTPSYGPAGLGFALAIGSAFMGGLGILAYGRVSQLSRTL